MASKFYFAVLDHAFDFGGQVAVEVVGRSGVFRWRLAIAPDFRVVVVVAFGKEIGGLINLAVFHHVRGGVHLDFGDERFHRLRVSPLAKFDDGAFDVVAGVL